MKRLLSFGLVFLLLLSACASPEVQNAPAPTPTPAPPPPVEIEAPPVPPAEPSKEEKQAEFLAFLESVNATRRAIYETPYPIQPDETWTPDLEKLSDGFSEAEITALLTPRTNIHAVTPQEAREDVETVFRLLRHSYGAYDYFGGDDVFLPIRDAVLAELPKRDDLTAADLERVLAGKLAPVLVDGHFMIGSTPMRTTHAKYMYYVPDLFLEDAQRIDPELLKPSLDDQGRLCRRLVALATPEEAKDLPKSAVVDGKTLNLIWIQDRTGRATSWDAFTESALEDGTPLLTSTSMLPKDEAYTSQLERLAVCGTEYADAPVLIMDVRSNRGGTDWYIIQWFEGYTGQSPNVGLFSAHKLSAVNKILYQKSDMLKYFSDSDIPGWSIRTPHGAWLEHDGLTLVLQNKGVASSGETAVTNLRVLSNTLFLGSGTLGCSLTPNNFSFYLPHSGLSLYFGTGLALFEDGTNRDGTGFLPDLWVPSEQALELAEKMIDYYDLNALQIIETTN